MRLSVIGILVAALVSAGFTGSSVHLSPAVSSGIPLHASMSELGGEQPNIIFIMADDLGWGDLACYGNREIRTPNLDALAREGTLFSQYYSCSPVCSPARAAILTGQNPAEIGVHTVFRNSSRNQGVGMANFLDPSLVVLPRMLEAAGYATGHYGKWHLGHLMAPSLDEYGFQEHRSYRSGPGNPHYNNAATDWKRHSSDLIIDDAIDFIDRHENEPFFLNVWLRDTHSIVDPSRAQRNVYPDLVPNTVGRFTSARQVYYATVTAMDAAIGRLIDEVDRRGLSDSTIIIFTSDNGPKSIYSANGDHSGVGSTGPFRGRKGSLYEGGTRIPMIVRWPGHTPAGVVDNVSNLAAIDWVPTIGALTGADCTLLEPVTDCTQLDGEDMSAALFGFQSQRTTDILMEWRFGTAQNQEPRSNVSPDVALIQGNWKLMLSRDGQRQELYDLSVDPMEVDNKVGDSSLMALHRMRARLIQWRDSLPECIGCENAGNNSYPWPE